MRARSRVVSPEYFTHPGLYALEARTGWPMRLAYQGLWCHADREGRFEWKPVVLKLGILPFDPVDFERVLDALVGGGYVVRYSAQGRVYGWIPTFTTYQTIHPREARSKLPGPPPDEGANGAGSGAAPGAPDAVSEPTPGNQLPTQGEPLPGQGMQLLAEGSKKSGANDPKVQENRAGGQLPVTALHVREIPPASTSTSASASASVGDVERPPVAVAAAALAQRLTGLPFRWDVCQWLEALPDEAHADAYARTFLGWLDGLGFAGGRACPPEALGALCRAWPTIEHRSLTERFVRRCAESFARDIWEAQAKGTVSDWRAKFLAEAAGKGAA